MLQENSTILKVSFSRWYIVLIGCCGFLTAGLSLAYIIYTVLHGEFLARLLRCSAFAILFLSILWFLARILFYVVYATEYGIRAKNILSKTEFIPWHEIVEIKGPKIGIPRDVINLITQDRRKIRLIKSMNNYSRLLELVKTRAPNLRSKDF